MFTPKVNLVKSTDLYRSLLKFFLNVLVCFLQLTDYEAPAYFELNFGGVGSGQVGDQGVTRQAERRGASSAWPSGVAVWLGEEETRRESRESGRREPQGPGQGSGTAR